VLFLVLLGLSCTLLVVTTVSADEGDGEDLGVSGFSAQGMSGSSSEDPTSTSAPDFPDSTTQPTPEGSSSDAPSSPPPDTSDPTPAEPAEGSEGSSDDEEQQQQQKSEKVSMAGLRNSPDSTWPEESQPARAGSMDSKTSEKLGVGEITKSDDAASPVEVGYCNLS